MSWIDVKNSMPNYQYINGIRFYIMNVVIDGVSEFAYFDAKDNCFLDYPHGYKINVTHWMIKPDYQKD